MNERAYRALLRLLPREFRERFEAEMLDTARQMAERGGRSPSAARALVDVLLTALTVRADDLRASIQQRSTRGSTMGAWLQDVRFALRGLRRDPLFTIFAIGTVGLGIGAGGTVFGVVDRLLLRGPDHVVDSDRVVRVYVSYQPTGMRRFTSAGVGHVTYALVRDRVGAFGEVASYTPVGASTLGVGDDARAVRLAFASGSFFRLLGVQPLVGRFFDEEADTPASEDRQVVLSHDTWLAEFGGRADAIGKTLVVGDVPHTVVGVAPVGFTGAELAPVDVWVPMTFYSRRVTTNWETSWNAQWMTVIGRLSPEASPETAGTELTNVFRAGYAGDDESLRVANLFVAPLRASDSGADTGEARVSRWLLVVSGLLLLAVGANLVNLLLARGIRRARELSVRLALGATTARVRRLVLAESLTLALAGALTALAVAYLLGGFVRRALLADIQWSSSPLDGRVLLVTFSTALLLGLAMGVAPALRAIALASASEPGKGGSRDGGGRTASLRASLSIAQAALSVAMLVGAGLFSRSLANALSTDLGIEPDKVLVMTLRRPPLAGLPAEQAAAERARRRAFSTEAVDRLAALPGVTHAALAVGLPFGNRFSPSLRIPGRDSVPRLSTGGPSISAVSGDYFATVGTPVLRGRPFRSGEGAGSERVTIVSETMAETLWPGEDALGKCVVAMADTTPCATVVGIAADTHRGSLREEPSMHYYIPSGQEIGFGGDVLLVRGGDDPLAVAPEVGRALREMDPSITFVSTQTIQQVIDPQLRPWRLGTAVLASSGMLALITMVVGIYSFTSYLVSLRTREIGVRLALGASGGRVARLVIGSAAATSAIGALIGLAGAYLAAGFLAPMLFEISPRDPFVFAGAAAILLASTVLACVVPCLRASRIDPIEALRPD